MAPTLPDVLDDLSMEELVERLERLGQQTTGTKATLCERLRKAMGGESSQLIDEQDNRGGKRQTRRDGRNTPRGANEGTIKTEAERA